MIHTHPRFAQAVEAAVREIEERTDAEVVVVAAGRSEHYRDVSVTVGVLLGFATLALAFYSPLPFATWSVPLDALLIGGIGSWLVHRSPRLLYRLIPAERMRRAVETAAAAAFHQEAVHGTRGRTGLLVYLATLERRVELLPDAGLDRRIPRARWNEIDWGRVDDVDEFVANLKRAGEILAAHVPPTGDNPNEIPNRPRIRP